MIVLLFRLALGFANQRTLLTHLGVEDFLILLHFRQEGLLGVGVIQGKLLV